VVHRAKKKSGKVTSGSGKARCRDWCILTVTTQQILNITNAIHAWTHTHTHTEELEQRSRYSDWLRTGQQRGQSSSPGRAKNVLRVVQTNSGSDAASYLMGTGGSFLGSKARVGLKLTTQLQQLPRSRKCGSIHPLPHTPSWCSA
jgi:hypothetical protein